MKIKKHCNILDETLYQHNNFEEQYLVEYKDGEEFLYKYYRAFSLRNKKVKEFGKLHSMQTRKKGIGHDIL